MIRNKAEILKFDDVVKLSDKIKLFLGGKLIWNKDVNKISEDYFTIDVEYKRDDGWYYLGLNMTDEDYIFKQMWDADFDIEDALFKTNVLSYVENKIKKLDNAE